MLKIVIKNTQNEVTNAATFETEELANAWLSQEIANCSFGKPERWVTEDKEDVSNALESREVILREAEALIIDPDTNKVILSSDPVVIIEYRLAATYTVEIVDVTAQVEQERVNQEALAYLASTDWMVIRAQEDPSKPVPQEVLTTRAAARDSIVR